MVGYAFMGAAHSQAWRTVNRVFDLPARARMVAVAGRDAAKVAAAAARLGWDEAVTDWRELVARDDIDLIDICTPGDSHAEIALAALAAGKHVLCEKPLANTVAEAEAMAAAAAAARAGGVRSMCGYNYRRVPAVALMAQLIAAGRIGTVRHVRAVYLQDWIVDPAFPLVWRLQREKAGSGALGDIGAHIVDLTQYVTGQTHHRPVRADRNVHHRTAPARRLQRPGRRRRRRRRAGDVAMGRVTVDDAALFVARLAGGAVATYEATRFATGRKNGLRVEVNGSTGSLVFDLERLNELEFYDATTGPDTQGFTRILVTESTHPYLTAWWPPGHIIGYEHSFTHQARDLIEAIATGTDPQPSFDDALTVQRVLDAVERSAKSGAWTPSGPRRRTGRRTDKGFPGPAARVGRGCAPRSRARPREGFRAPERGCDVPCSGPNTGRAPHPGRSRRCAKPDPAARRRPLVALASCGAGWPAGCTGTARPPSAVRLRARPPGRTRSWSSARRRASGTTRSRPASPPSSSWARPTVHRDGHRGRRRVHHRPTSPSTAPSCSSTPPATCSTPDQQAAFESYVSGGGGYVGVHAAADTEYDWPFYGELVGAWFATTRPSSRRGWSSRTGPTRRPPTSAPTWPRTDEWYDFRTNPRAERPRPGQPGRVQLHRRRHGWRPPAHLVPDRRAVDGRSTPAAGTRPSRTRSPTSSPCCWAASATPPGGARRLPAGDRVHGDLTPASLTGWSQAGPGGFTEPTPP